MSRFLDIADRRFGRLVAVKKVDRAKNGNAIWFCTCDCGNTTRVDVQTLLDGDTRSCGCLKAEKSREKIKSNEKTSRNIGNLTLLKDENGVFFSSLSVSKRNRTGVIGVSYDERSNKWFARLKRNGQYVLLKQFATFEEAKEARKEAEKMYFKKSS